VIVDAVGLNTHWVEAPENVGWMVNELASVQGWQVVTAAAAGQRNISRQAAAGSEDEVNIVAVTVGSEDGIEVVCIVVVLGTVDKSCQARAVDRVGRVGCAGRAHWGWCRECR